MYHLKALKIKKYIHKLLDQIYINQSIYSLLKNIHSLEVNKNIEFKNHPLQLPMKRI